jgi:nucleoside-diphosphate-sugar epimerase
VSINPKKPTICVIGCGWLGFPLAKRLISTNFEVFGTTTSSEKLKTLENAGINPVLYALGSASPIPVADVYFVNVPPSGVVDYLDALKSLVLQIPTSARLIFCSTTSVYRDLPDYECLESDVQPGVIPDDPDLDVARHGTPRRTLIQAEGIVAQHPDYLILRLAGLYGGDRHPVKYLSGRANLSTPNARVNLIHLDDLIETGLKVITNAPHFKVMNVCSGEHPTRKEYYIKAAIDRDLTPPEFNLKDTSTGKIIANSLFVNFMGYNPTLR